MNSISLSKNNQNDDEQFRTFVSAINDYTISMLDVTGRVVSWNAGTQRIKGYAAHEIAGQHFSRFYTPEDLADGPPKRALRTAVQEGKFESEGWRIRKNGTRFWASVVIHPVFRDGELIGFTKVTRDITDRALAAEALRKSEQQFSLLVQGVTDYAIYMLGASGFITSGNPGAQHIKVFSAKKVIGTHFSRFHT